MRFLEVLHCPHFCHGRVLLDQLRKGGADSSAVAYGTVVPELSSYAVVQAVALGAVISAAQHLPPLCPRAVAPCSAQRLHGEWLRRCKARRSRAEVQHDRVRYRPLRIVLDQPRGGRLLLKGILLNRVRTTWQGMRTKCTGFDDDDDATKDIQATLRGRYRVRATPLVSPMLRLRSVILGAGEYVFAGRTSCGAGVDYDGHLRGSIRHGRLLQLKILTGNGCWSRACVRLVLLLPLRFPPLPTRLLRILWTSG